MLTQTCKQHLNYGSMLYKISSTFLDNLLLLQSSFSLLTLGVLESPAAFWLFPRKHNRGGLTCLPTQVWHYCAVFAAGLENFFCSNYKLNIMSLHKCLHGQILMNNFPPAFITRLCRKVLYVYWPSDAMGWARSLWLFKQFLLHSIIYLFFSVIDWAGAALWAVCVSLFITWNRRSEQSPFSCRIRW